MKKLISFLVGLIVGGASMFVAKDKKAQEKAKDIYEETKEKGKEVYKKAKSKYKHKCNCGCECDCEDK